MKKGFKAMSFKDMIEMNGGYMLPEVVIVGHKKTAWEKIQEALQNVDWYMMYLNRF